MNTKLKEEFPSPLYATNARKVPWGYDFNAETHEAIADYQQLEYLHEAFNRLDTGESLRTVLGWLIEESKESISLTGLQKSWHRHRPDSPVIL